MMGGKAKSGSQKDRVLLYCADQGPFTAQPFLGDREGRLVLSGHSTNSRKIVCVASCLEALVCDDLLAQKNQTYSLSKPGKARVRRLRSAGSPSDPHQQQHRKTFADTVILDGAKQPVFRNLNESPLGRLSVHKNPDGTPWLGGAEIAAGERLRLDFTKARLMQGVGSNWSIGLGVSGKSSGAGGNADLTDAALDARDRLNRALDYVGPEIGQVLTDVCCYLKGLETVERERRWPPRSAKLLLRAGLGLLSRFYGTNAGQRTGYPAAKELPPEARL